MTRFCLFVFLIINGTILAGAQTPRLASTYDKFKDITHITTSEETVKGTRNNPLKAVFSLTLIGRLGHSGTVLKGPVARFQLWFYSRTSEWQFVTYNSLVILADGGRIVLGKARYDGQIEKGYRTVGVRETMGYMIDRADLEKITSAKNVEFQLGQFEGAFEADDLQILSMLLKAGTF